MDAASRERSVRGATRVRRSLLLGFAAIGMAAASPAQDLRAYLKVDLHACAGSGYGYSGSGELADGRALLSSDGTLTLLSPDRRTLQPVDWPASVGRVTGMARLPGRGLLVGAGFGLRLLDDAGRWHDLGDCERTGTVSALFRHAQGRVLLTTERGVFAWTADAGLRQVTAVPVQGLLAMQDGRWLAEAGGALYGLNESGTIVPLLTGTKASRRAFDARYPGWQLSERSPSDWIRVGRGGQALLSSGNPPVVIAASGRVELLRAPDGRAIPGQSQVLSAGGERLFLLLESGLHVLTPGASWRRVSTDVRWTQGCIGDSTPIGHGHMLVRSGRQVFVITADSKAVLLRTVEGHACPEPGKSLVATADGGAWIVADGLFRLQSDGRLVRVAWPDGAGTPSNVQRVGRTHVIVQAGEQLFRIDPRGHTVPLGKAWPFADTDDRLHVCTKDSNQWLRWLDGSRLEPVAAAAGRACSWADVLRDGSLVVKFRDEGPALRIDRTGAALPVPGEHFTLSDGDFYLDRKARSTFVHVSGRTSGIDPPPWLAARAPTQRTALLLNARLHFLDARRGFGVTGYGSRTLAVTSDGGQTWRPIRMGAEADPGLNALAFADDGRHGMAVGKNGRIWTTPDGGIHWERRPDLGEHDLAAVWLPGDASRAFVLTRDDGLYLSGDDGRTWVSVPRPPDTGTPALGGTLAPTDRWPAFSDRGRRLWWTADEGDVMSSTDEGRTWSLQWRYRRDGRTLGYSGANTRLPSVALFGGSTGPACVPANGGLFCSEPGKSVMVCRSDVDMAFTDLALAGDGVHGWAVGADGLILATADAGTHWTQQASGTEAQLSGIFFLPDALHGWAWGDSVLLVTRDGGQRWERVLPRMLD